MAYWHNWWNQLSSFQRQLILLVSMVDDFWNSLTEGQKTVTGIILHSQNLCSVCAGVGFDFRFSDFKIDSSLNSVISIH